MRQRCAIVVSVFSARDSFFFLFFFLTPFILQSRYQWSCETLVESSVFLYLGLLLLFVFVLDSLVYGVGVCLAGKSLPLISQEGCCVAFLLYSPSTS